jgi:type II secretory pathway pseudopilin PulG
MAAKPRGLSLLEVSASLGVLAVAISGMTSLFISYQRSQILVREEQIALTAIQQLINEMRAAPFSTSTGEKIVADFNKETRTVNLDGPGGQNQRLSMDRMEAPGGGDGLKVDNEMGVILVNEENPNEGHFGDVDGDGDRDFPIDLNQNGKTTDSPVTGSIFPLDLGGDNTLTNETIAPSLLKIVPVVVVVRWQSISGLDGSVQVLTLITDRSGKF